MKKNLFAILSVAALLTGLYMATTGQRVLDSNGTSGGDGVQTLNTSTGSVAGLPPVTTTTNAIRCWMADQITLEAYSSKTAVESTLTVQFSRTGTGSWTVAASVAAQTAAALDYGCGTHSNFAVAADSLSTAGKSLIAKPTINDGTTNTPNAVFGWRYCRFTMVTKAGAPNGTITMNVTTHYHSVEAFSSAQSN